MAALRRVIIWYLNEENQIVSAEAVMGDLSIGYIPKTGATVILSDSPVRTFRHVTPSRIVFFDYEEPEA